MKTHFSRFLAVILAFSMILPTIPVTAAGTDSTDTLSVVANVPATIVAPQPVTVYEEDLEGSASPKFRDGTPYNLSNANPAVSEQTLEDGNTVLDIDYSKLNWDTYKANKDAYLKFPTALISPVDPKALGRPFPKFTDGLTFAFDFRMVADENYPNAGKTEDLHIAYNPDAEPNQYIRDGFNISTDQLESGKWYRIALYFYKSATDSSLKRSITATDLSNNYTIKLDSYDSNPDTFSNLFGNFQLAMISWDYATIDSDAELELATSEERQKAHFQFDNFLITTTEMAPTHTWVSQDYEDYAANSTLTKAYGTGGLIEKGPQIVSGGSDYAYGNVLDIDYSKIDWTALSSDQIPVPLGNIYTNTSDSGDQLPYIPGPDDDYTLSFDFCRLSDFQGEYLWVNIWDDNPSNSSANRGYKILVNEDTFPKGVWCRVVITRENGAITYKKVIRLNGTEEVGWPELWPADYGAITGGVDNKFCFGLRGEGTSEARKNAHFQLDNISLTTPITASVSPNTILPGSVAPILAAYDSNGKMTAVLPGALGSANRTTNLKTTNATFDIIPQYEAFKDAATVKAFFWESLATAKPYAAYDEIGDEIDPTVGEAANDTVTLPITEAMNPTGDSNMYSVIAYAVPNTYTQDNIPAYDASRTLLYLNQQDTAFTSIPYEEALYDRDTQDIVVTIHDGTNSVTTLIEATNPVAKIGDVEFETLEEAIAAANGGDEIVLLADATISKTTNINRSITINGNGNTITQTADFAGNASNAMFDIMGGAAVTFNNLTFDGIKTVAIMRTVDASVVIDGCVIENCEHTAAQGLLRLSGGDATVKGTKFLNNSCSALLTFNYDIDSSVVSEDKLVVENCEFTGNDCADTALIYYAKGYSSEIKNNTFTNNTVDTTSHGAILYYSEGANSFVTGNTFTGNTIEADSARAGVAVLEAGITVTGNVFANNTISSTNSGTTYVATVVNKADADTDGVAISGNYWGGNAPDFVSAKGAPTTVDSYYETYTDGTLGGLVQLKPDVVQIGDVTYATFEEAAAAAKAGDEIVLLADIDGDITVPAGVTFNGNGFTVNGTIYADGDITFAGITKATWFDVNYVNTTVNIGKGASLQLTGTGRMSIGHGCTFNIEGTITDAKTANIEDVVPSLIAPGASFTGDSVTFNVTNAYIKFTAYCSSKNKAANGTFDFNVVNSIWDQTGSLVFSEPTEGMDPTFNFELKDSVLTSTSHLVFAVTKGEIVIDNSNVNVDVYRQLENRSTMTIKNGSVVYASVATSQNAINPGTTIVDNATYITSGTFTGSDDVTGALIVKNGAEVTTVNIAKANVTVDTNSSLTVSKFDTTNTTVTIDATNFDGTDVNVIKGADMSTYADIITVSGNADVVLDGNGVTVVKAAVAQIGDVKYATLAEAIAALKDGDMLAIFAGTHSEGTIKFPASLKNVIIIGAEGAILKDMTLMACDGSNIAYEGMTFDNIVFDNSNILFPGQRASAVFKDWKITNCEFKNVARGNAAISFNLNASEAMENFTFTNNSIDGVTGGNYSGLVLRASKGNVVITGNDVKNVAWNAIQLINTTATTLTIEDNTFASSADEGVLNLYNVSADTMTINSNKFMVTEGQSGVAYLGSGDVSGNYWNGSAPSNLPDGVTCKNYYTALDADGTIDEESLVSTSAITGTGTEEDPFVISNIEGLKEFAANVNGGNSYDNQYIKLDGDIDLNNEEWTPIGTSANPFKGMFDGGNHTISNLYINWSTDYVKGGDNKNYVGLFGNMNGAGNNSGIKNLTIKNVDISGCLYVGSILGRGYTSGLIENCHVTGSVKIEGYSYIGGIVGRYEYSTGTTAAGVSGVSISNCSVIATTTDKGTINGIYEGATYIGGILGFTTEPNPVMYFEKLAVENISVTGYSRVGGISGIAHQGNTYTECSVSDAYIYGTDGMVGLIVGACQGTENSPVTFTGNTVDAETKAYSKETEVANLYGTNINGGTSVTNFVAQIGDTYYETLADALAAAQSGDTVTLLADVELDEIVIFRTAGNITIDGNNKTITLADDFTDKGWGAAIMLGGASGEADDAAAPNHIYTIKNVTFDDFTTKVIRAQGVTLNLEDCVISDANVSVDLMGLDYTQATLTRVTFENNKTTGEYNALINYNFNADKDSATNLTMTNCTFDGNTARFGLVLAQDGDGEFTLTNSTFTNNTVSDAGSSVVFTAMSSEITGNYFAGNSTQKASVVAGPWVEGDYTIAITDNAFADTASTAVHVEDWATQYNATTSFDLSANYWNGGEPDYEMTGEPTVELEDYYTTYEDGVLGGRVENKKFVAEVNGVQYESLAEAIAAANDGEVKVLCNVEESFTGIENVTFTTTVEGGVTITNTFAEDEWIAFNNVTIGSGVTLITPNVLINGAVEGGSTNVIEGTLIAGLEEKAGTTFYQYNDAKTIVRNGGNIIVKGDTVLRYNYDPDSGIFIYGDGDASTVEYSSGLNYSGGYIGAYSGTFYAEDAVVNAGGLRLDYKKDSSEEADKYAPINAEFVDSTVSVTTELRFYKDSTMTLTGSQVSAGKVQVRAEATPVITADANSSIKADTVEVVPGALVDAILGEDGTVSFKPMVAQVGTKTYSSLQAAIDAAQGGDTVTVIANVSDAAVTVNKSLTITGDVTLTNVSINAVEGATELTVSGLTFKGNSWINSGAADKLTVSGVTANVTPSNGTYTNSRSAFISLGRSEQKTLELIIKDSNIVAAGGADPVLGWAQITSATITGNTFGSETAHQSNSDSIKFMSIADGAVFTITGNTIYSDYNGIVFGQNTTRENAYTANISGNTFVGGADHVWIEVSGSATTHATINATSTNTVNGNAFTAEDIKLHPNLNTFTSYLGVDVDLDENGKVIGGTFAKIADDMIAEGYVLDENNAVVEGTYVAEINGVQYASLQAAIDAATADDTVVLLTDIALADGVTVAADKVVTLDLNGKTLSRNTDMAISTAAITNNGNLTIQDSVGGGKITAFAANPDTAGVPYYANNTITNCGVLTIKSGTIENSTGNEARAAYPIDNNSTSRDAILNIEGGTITGRGAIRQFANSTTHKNEVNITGGNVSGTSYGIWVQNPGSGDPKASLNISNGAVAKILFSPSANFKAAITGGTIQEVAIWEADTTNTERNPAGFISGGTFNNAVAEEFVADGFIPTENADGTYGVIEGTYVAEVNGVKYATVTEAIDAADGETVTLLAPITVAAGEELTIDLKGQTVVYTSDVLGESMITNRGELTINDSVGGGSMTYVYTGANDASYGKGNYAINTSGKLTVNGGTLQIEAKDCTGKFAHAMYVINTTGEVTVNGGKILNNNNIALRTFGAADVTVNGGEIEGLRAIWIQLPSNDATKAPVVNLTVNGGTLTGTAIDGTADSENVLAVYSYSYGNDMKNVTIKITDGTINGDIALTGGANKTNIETVNITGGTFNGKYGEVYSYGDDELAKEAITIKGGTFATNVAEMYAIDDGYIFKANNDGTYGAIEGTYVAEVNGVKYATVTEAINAANDGDTVQLLPGTISEYIAPWASDTTHASEKSITIIGAENFGTTLTDGMYLGYDDSGCRAHTITVKGIAFEGKGIVVAGQQTVVIDGNKFTNITDVVVTDSTANANAISILGKDVNATVTNNIIDRAEVAGINLRNVTVATVKGNTITNTQHNSITVSATDGTDTVVIENNNMSNWGLGGEGRAVRVNLVEDATVTGNVMTTTNAPEEFAKITGASTIDASKNYWNGVDPTGIFATDSETHLALILKNYYTDADKTNLVPLELPVAEVNGEYYATLAEAINAVAQTGGTVKLVGDVTETYVMVPTGITLDLNGKIITTGNFASFGNVIDGEIGGNGAIATTNVYLLPANTFMPIYDSANECYRLFAHETVNRGGKTDPGVADAMQYGLAIRFANPEAYKLIQESTDPKIVVTFSLDVVDATGNVKKTYTLNCPDGAIKTWAANAYEHYSGENVTTDRVITLRVRNISALPTGSTIQLKCTVTSATNFAVTD